MSSPTTPAFYRVKEVAVILAVSEFEVRRLVNVGTLHARPIGEKGRQFRITAQSVQNHVEDLTDGRPWSARGFED